VGRGYVPEPCPELAIPHSNDNDPPVTNGARVIVALSHSDTLDVHNAVSDPKARTAPDFVT